MDNNKMLLLLFCFLNLNLIVLPCAAEHDYENFSNRQAYSINNLLQKNLGRLQRSRVLKDESPSSLFNLHFKGFDPDVELQDQGNSTQNGTNCLSDLLYILMNVKNLWALSLFDSFGKPESGILQGHSKWVGDYNECIQVRSTNPNSTQFGNFRGRYCSVSWSLPIPNSTMPIAFTTGICVPDSCSGAELQSLLQFSHVAGVFPTSNETKSPSSATISCKPTEREWTAPAIVVIFLLSLFSALSVLGSSITVVKYFKNVIEESKQPSLVVNIPESEHVIGDGGGVPEKNSDKDNESLIKDMTSGRKSSGKLQTFLLCFCVFTNGAKLLNTDSSEGQLLCIHGIRFLSMSWVILGHAYMFGFAETGNTAEAMKLIDNFPFQVVLQAFYSVDSFFVLSGFLLTYLAMKEFAKTKGVISWPYFYIHRYIRLTPMYMVLLGFSATVYYYLGSGPFWSDGVSDPHCTKHWWWNLLYINNFNDMGEMCMGWSWYLSNDMQFFVISPLFLITLWRWPKIGYGLVATFLFACWICNFWITYHFDLGVGMTDVIGISNTAEIPQQVAKFTSYFDKIYTKPYTRIAPYLIGMITGYVLFKRNACNRPKHSWAFICSNWIVAAIITLTSVYGLYHKHPTVIVSSFYNALNRSIFSLGLCWVIYVCLVGQGGIVNKILSYKLFIPLSRLTYAAYLIHPMIITGYYTSLKTSLEFSHATVVFIYLGFMLVTYGLSLPVALILESPIVSLEKLVRKSFSKKENS